MSRRGKYDKSAPSRRPGSLARELVVLAARIRGVVLFAFQRVDDFIVIVARQLARAALSSTTNLKLHRMPRSPSPSHLRRCWCVPEQRPRPPSIHWRPILLIRVRPEPQLVRGDR